MKSDPMLLRVVFGSLSKSLLHNFRLSLEEVIFPDDLKTAKGTPILKAGDENDFGFPKYLRKSCIKDFLIIH